MASTQIYQLKVTLKDIRPPVWRRVQVASDIKLGKLHRIIQDAMGWTDSHLHAFNIGGENYGIPDPDFESDIHSECNVKLNDIAQAGDRVSYEYDFGDGWRHEILVGKELPVEPGMHYPRCLTGKRVCPPEDCGGVWGYQNPLNILANPKREEYGETLEWLGGECDPETFELNEVNDLLRKVR